MKTKYSLRWRVTLAMLALVSLSSIVYAFGVYFADHALEEALLDTRVKQEMETLIARLKKNEAEPLIQSADVRTYLRSQARAASIPNIFSDLAPGFYHDIEIDGRYYDLSVRDIGDDRAYVALDVSDVERKEQRLMLFLLQGALVTTAIAIWIGFWLSRKVIAPVSSLAEQVAGLDPNQRNIRLGPRFHGYEVEVIARAFDRYLERVDHLVEREQSFTAVASHELRSPLAVISTSAEVLESDPRLPEPLSETVARIRHAVRDMSEFTTAILFLAREPEVSESAIETKTAVQELVPEIVDHYRTLLRNRAVTFELAANDRLVVSAPQSHIEIVIGNLLRNAAAYTDSGQIVIGVRDRRLTIADTGRGIAAQDLEHIFERHYRGAGSQGHGLGLYIAKRISDRYGWRLAIVSRPGEGATATLEF